VIFGNFTVEDWTDRLFRNVVKELLYSYAA